MESRNRVRKIVALSLAFIVITAASAAVDVKDFFGAPSQAGVISLVGTGVGSATAPFTTAGITIGTTSAAISGSTLTVNDPTGTTKGWTVTASFVPLTSAQLAAITLPAGYTAVANLTGAQVNFSAATTTAQATANSTGAAGAATYSTNQNLANAATIATTAGDGRGATTFNTTFTVTLPAVSSLTGVLYTGSILYTLTSNP